MIAAGAGWSIFVPNAAPAPPQTFEPGVLVIGADSGQTLEPLNLALANPRFVSMPVEIPKNVRIDMKRFGKPRIGVVAPEGLTNLALDKPVTSSDDFPIIGDLDMVTNGNKDALDGHFVELKPGPQWVQIDLEERREIWAIAFWHNHLDPRYYRDVVVQISDDPDFATGVLTVFDNDDDNSSGHGVGSDFEYRESYEGEVVDAGGARARYVRLWSKGSTADDANHYSEVEVWGREPVKGPLGKLYDWIAATLGLKP